MNDNSITTNTDSTLRDGTPSLISHSYDELFFIQNLFESIYKQPSDEHLQELLPLDSLYSSQVNDDQTFIKNDEIGSSSTNPSKNMNKVNTGNDLLKEDTSRSHLWSDLYVAYLLNEVGSPSSTLDYYCENPDMDLMWDQSPLNGKKEMDLIEMVSSSQLSQGSSSSFQ
ncbi:hypothetical protein NE237_004260 [Protea cynaroides]|uniref:Uncharacterized protein n=1 Tax=Protea cynaroides TaxID=273540 RepID=A0A9Q0KJ31_9MAGN|nr:hypothetical protein NE237_004260 [Protea cynaroides]